MGLLMRRIFSILIETIFWLQFFITPVGLGALIGIFIYIGNKRLLWLSIIIMSISVVIGVLYAERVRRKHGASRYASRILSTPDIWPDDIAEDIEPDDKNQEVRSTKK